MLNTIKEKIGELPILELAKSSQFIKREPKKINPIEYVCTFMQCMITGDISQAAWARELSQSLGEPISEQALQNKVQIPHEEFAKALLEAGMAKVLESKINAIQSCPTLRSFSSIKAHDSTCVKVPDGLMGYFPGSKSQNGGNAQARIQLSIDLLKDTYTKIHLSNYRKNDQSYAMEMVSNVQSNELNLFDLGYFKIDALSKISESEAFYLSRYKYKVNIFEKESGKQIDLVKHLKKLDKQGIKTWDTTILLGSEHKFETRIIAIKVPQEVAVTRRKKKKMDENSMGQIMNTYWGGIYL